VSGAIRLRLHALGWLGAAGLLSAIIACGVTQNSPAPVDTAPGTWTRLASMPSVRQEVAVGEAGGRIYVIGGFGAGLAATHSATASCGTSRGFRSYRAGWANRDP
jgi:hypothetical protein